MSARTTDDAKLNTLRGLATDPSEQARYALRLLETERSLQVAQAALRVLEERTDPAARPVLLKRYAAVDAAGPKRDPGGLTRASILRGLRRIARQDDVALLEHAATTYEFLPPGRSEEGQLIRAAALVVLNEVDSVRCSYHCARLLVDEHTSDLTGEPAATAIQLLAAQGNLLPLYQRVMQGPPRPPEPSEVLAECLKHLVDLPDSLLAGVVEQHGRSTNEVVLVGLFDLLLEHRAGPSFAELVAEFLRTTRAHSVYRYVVMAMVAGRKASFLALLPEVARRERDPRKLDSLVEALSLLKGNQEMDTLAEELRSRLP